MNQASITRDGKRFQIHWAGAEAVAELAGNARWNCDIKPLEAQETQAALCLQVNVEAAEDIHSGLFELRLSGLGGGPEYWRTLPGVFYGENLTGVGRTIFPRDSKLNWSFRADACPAPGLHFPGKEFGYAFFCENDRVRPTGGLVLTQGSQDILGVGWNGSSARFNFPCQEEPQAYRAWNALSEPRQPRLDLKKGQGFSFNVWCFKTGAGKQAYFAPLRFLSKRLKPKNLAPMKDSILESGRYLAQCMKETHFLEGKGYSHCHSIHEIHTGWCGGFAAVRAALLYGELTGDEEFRRQGETMADFLCPGALSECGVFNSQFILAEGAWRAGVNWAVSDGLHIRNASEGCLFLGKILQDEAKAGRQRQNWRDAFFSNLHAVEKMLEPDGRLPIQVDPKTGLGIDFAGATPGLWAGSFAMGAGLAEGDQAKKWLEIGSRIGDYYLKHHVLEELFFGGPYDADKAPNMEDPYGLLISYLRLYEGTKAPRFLDAAKRCADHLLSWRYLYAVQFPEGTICAQENVSTFGMAPASVRNRHIQNWETIALPELLELMDLTEDPWYRDCVWQLLQQSCQLIERGAGRLELPLGGQSEQWYATEFKWFGQFGDYSKGNMWKMSVVLPKTGFLMTLHELARRGELEIKPLAGKTLQ